MHCPVCGQELVGGEGEEVRCEAGQMALSAHLADALMACYVEESRRPSDKPLGYRPSGPWFCPACGVKAEDGADFVRCPNCGRALNEFLYELIHRHYHAPTPFWIEFDYSAENNPPVGTPIGVGVTAVDRDDALRLVAHRVFSDRPLPPLREIRENVDVTSLDERHVLPHIGPPHVRGIWFPQGYEQLSGED